MYLQDIGSAAYTEYDLGKDLVRFYMQNPEFMGMRMGHIHSHNSMDVFFSGTDDSEIKDNSEFHATYLSLIVNNDNDMCAKIAFRVTKKMEGSVTYRYKYLESETPLLETPEDKEEVIICIYDCDIEKPALVDATFLSRLSTVQEENRAKVRVYTPHAGQAAYYANRQHTVGFQSPGKEAKEGKEEKEEAKTQPEGKVTLIDPTTNKPFKADPLKGFNVNERYQGREWETGEMGITEADISVARTGVQRDLFGTNIDSYDDDFIGSTLNVFDNSEDDDPNFDDVADGEINLDFVNKINKTYVRRLEAISPATDEEALQLASKILNKDLYSTEPLSQILKRIENETPAEGYYANHDCFDNVEVWAPKAYQRMYPEDKEFEGFVPTIEKIIELLETHGTVPTMLLPAAGGVIEVFTEKLI